MFYYRIKLFTKSNIEVLNMIKINGKPVYLDGIDDNTPDNYTRRVFNQLLHQRQLSLTNLVAMYNGASTPENKTTTQNISNKLTRNSMKFRDLVELADFAGYDVNFVSRQDSNAEPQPEESRSIRKSYSMGIPEESLNDAIFKGAEIIKGVNFPKILVAGERALEASQWIQQYLDDGMSELEEMTVLMTSGQLFNVIAKPADVPAYMAGRQRKK